METENTMPTDTPGPSQATHLYSQTHEAESFTIPEKIIRYLTEHMPEAYCDDCLASALSLRRTQVNTISSTLGFCQEYSRGAQTCTVCQKTSKAATRRASL